MSSKEQADLQQEIRILKRTVALVCSLYLRHLGIEKDPGFLLQTIQIAFQDATELERRADV